MTAGVVFGNRILDIVVIAWFAAQGYKAITSIIKERRFNFKKFIESGGMPSSHTSSVTALVTTVAIKEGVSSTIFAVSFVFAIIVMYDASGVRRAAGKHAGVLNRLVDILSQKDKTIKIEEELKELIGHTPFEVVVGAILGIVVAYIMAVFAGY
jgi:uncharacterized protein